MERWTRKNLIKPQVFNSLYNLKPIRSSFLFMADIWIDTFSWNQIFLRHQKYRFVTVYYFFPRFLLVINRRRDYSELLTRLTTLRNSIPSDETTPFLDQTRGGVRLRDPDAHPGTSFNGRLTKIDPPGVHTINRSEALWRRWMNVCCVVTRCR